MKNLFFLFILTSLQANAQSADQIYSFGQSCGATGQWTAKALQASHSLVSVINNLQNVPECKGLKDLSDNLMAQIAQAPHEVMVANDTSSNVDAETSNQVESKLTALSNVALSPNSSLQDLAQQAYTKEALRSTLTNQSMRYRQFQLARHKTFLFADRAANVMASAGALTNFATTLPTYKSCIIGRSASDLGLIASSVVGLGAAIASNNNGPAPFIGQMVQSVLQLVHDSKFSAGLSTLNKTIFNQSMQCLLDSSTESYCAVIDMQDLTKNKAVRTEVPKGTSVTTDAMSGYNILTIHLPNIYQWVQQVQFGAPSKSDGDALSKNNAIQFNTTFQTKRNLLTTILPQMQPQLVGKSPVERKAQLVNAIASMLSTIDDNNPINFFYLSKNKFELPFYLLDEADHIPACIYNNNGGCTWDAAVNTPGAFPRLDNFDDSYIAIVSNKLDSLISDANEQANVYYQIRVVPNVESLAVNSLNGIPYSVKDSFVIVSQYLVYLKDFLQKNGADDPGALQIIPAIDHTYYKVSQILQAYNKLDEVKKLTSQTAETGDAIRAAYAGIVGSTYDQFEMSTQHDGYIVATLNDYISAEYRLRLRKGIGLGIKERQFLITSSNDLLNNIRSAQFGNKNDISNDLANANTINSANLEALDQVFFDSMYRTIIDLNGKIARRDLSDSAMNQTSEQNAYSDVHSGVLKKENPFLMSLPIGNPAKVWLAEKLHPDRYPESHNIDVNTRKTGDNAHGDFKRQRDVLCLQSLAFVSRRARFDTVQNLDANKKLEQPLSDIKKICRDVVLQSEYWDEIPAESQAQFANLNFSYNDLLASTQRQIKKGLSKADQDKAIHYQQIAEDNAICAYRNFRRNNLVYWLTKDINSRPDTPRMTEIISDRNKGVK